MDIKDIVNFLIKKHKTSNPFFIAKELHITILFEDLGNIMGYHNYDSRFHFIHINQTLSEGERIFTCAHELGHVILHQKVNTSFLKRNTFCSVDRIEREANTFAVEMLIPDPLLKDYIGYPINTIAKLTGVPQELVGLKTKFHQI